MGTNGCDSYTPADLCPHPCKRLLGQTWAAVIYPSRTGTTLIHVRDVKKAETDPTQRSR